jgi:uncharacterized protein YgiB involved in biofilm formation
MRVRLGFLVGFGAGYVLGAKAGRERYEQIRRLYDNLTATPAFREASGKARSAVGAGFEQAKDKAAEGVTKAAGAVKGKKDERGGLSVAPPPTH